MTELEISFFLLLILLGLLNAKPPLPRLSIVLLIVGILLAFIPPVVKVIIPWDVVIGLTIPILLWQNARRLFYARWISRYIDIILFLSTIMLYSILVAISDDLLWYGSILFGIIAAGIIWRAGEPESASSYFSQLGPLLLIFLLTEIEPALQSPNKYFGSLFSGAGFGCLVAFLSVYLARKVSKKHRNWIAIGQLYIAYWLAYILGVSSLSASVTNLIVFIGLGFYYSLWEENRLRPAPLNSQLGFTVLLLLFLLVGWQAHQPLTARLIIEVIIGSGIALIVAWIGIRINLPSFQNLHSPWSTGIRITTYLLPALLLWPRGAIKQPALIVIAVIATGLLLVVSTRMTHYYIPEKPAGEIDANSYT
jgi:hypothetical protein